MSAHTEGPWIAAEAGDYSDYGGNCIVVLGEGGNIRTAVVLGIGDEDKANARLIAAAPDLLAEVEREYIELADVHNNWPGRDTQQGQSKLGRLRDLIAMATGRSERDVQDDYGTRAAIARSAS